MFTKFKKCSWFLKYGENILMNNFEENFLIMSNSVLYLMKQISNLMNIFELDEQKFYTRKNKLKTNGWIIFEFNEQNLNFMNIFSKTYEQIWNLTNIFAIRWTNFLILMNILKFNEQKLSGWTFFELLNIFPIDEIFWIRWTKSIRKFKNKIRKKSK